MKVDKEALYTSSIGIEIALSIGVGMYFGWWLDNKFETYPWFFIVFSIAGLGSAIKAVIRVIKIVEGQDSELDKTKDGQNDEKIEKIDGLALTKENFSDDDNLPD